MPHSQKIRRKHELRAALHGPSLYFTGNPTLVAEISQASGTASNGNMA
jgi:hypothetical protein